MKNSKLSICPQCEQKDYMLESGVCPHCDRMNRKYDYETQLCNGVSTDITKDNIHLYYEFMSDEDIISLDRNNIDLSKIHDQRLEQILSILNLNVCDVDIFHKTKIHSYYFGVKDILKPINEYIEDIKASSEYKAYLATKM